MVWLLRNLTVVYECLCGLLFISVWYIVQTLSEYKITNC